MSKSEEYWKGLEESCEHSSQTLSNLESMNHKTIEDVKEVIVNEFKKGGYLMEHRILTELEKLKLQLPT